MSSARRSTVLFAAAGPLPALMVPPAWRRPFDPVLLRAQTAVAVVPRASRSELLDVRGNYANLRDSADRIVYTPALPGAPPAVFAEWMRLLRTSTRSGNMSIKSPIIDISR